MTSPLVQQVAQTIGQPSSVRVGTVSGLNPLTVMVQGAVMTNIGVLSTYAPQLNDTVILLGQSSQAGTDPTSWVALGVPSSQGLRILQTQSDTTFTLGAESSVPGTLINFTTTAPSTAVVAFWTADFNVIGATITTAVVRPILDGVIQNQIQAIMESPVAAATGRWTISNQAAYGVAPGNHTIQLTGGANNAGNISLVAGSTNLLVYIYG